MNVFEVVKENVTARQAAEAYGLKVGRTGMACCPFHSDKSPSMKLDERYYCFGCGVTGDAVDLTAKLFGIGLREAAVKLAEDFGLNYDSRQKPSIRPRIREPTPEQKYQKEENHCYKVLTDYFHLLREWEKKYAPKQPDEEWNPLFAEALHKKNYIEYLGHDYDEPKQWELREINDIMNNAVTGWRAFSNPRYFPEPYRRQKGWERIRNDNEPDNSTDGFQEIPTEEMEQLGLPEEWLKQK